MYCNVKTQSTYLKVLFIYRRAHLLIFTRDDLLHSTYLGKNYYFSTIVLPDCLPTYNRVKIAHSSLTSIPDIVWVLYFDMYLYKIVEYVAIEFFGLQNIPLVFP